MRCGFLFIFLASLCFHNVLSLPFAQEQDKSTDSKATESKPGAAKPIDSKPSITKDKSTPASKDAATPKTEAKDTNTKTKPPATQDDQQVQIKLQGAEVPADLIVPATTLVTAGVGGYIYRKEIESLLRGYVLGFNPREAQMDRLKELIPKSHPMYAAIETCVKGLVGSHPFFRDQTLHRPLFFPFAHPNLKHALLKREYAHTKPPPAHYHQIKQN